MLNPKLTPEEQTLISNHFPADTTIIDISRGMPSILAEPSFNPLYFYDATDHSTVSLGLAEDFPAKHIRDGQRILVRHSDKASDKEQLLLELSGLRFEVIAQTETASLVDRISSNFRTALELVQSVLHHDAKDTTYKIILLTALNLIANQRLDLHPKDRDVPVPLDLLMKEIFKLNLPLYWNGANKENVYFRQGPSRNGRSDTVIGRAFRSHPLSQYNYLKVRDLLHSSKLDDQINRGNSVEKILRLISKTFIEQPIPRLGSELGELKNRLGLEKNQQLVHMSSDNKFLLVPKELWEVFFRLGPTLHSIFINHWAIMICGFNKEARIQVVLDALYFESKSQDARPQATKLARKILGGKSLVCYLSGRKSHKTHIDHVLPWAFFRINSLWNLMPMDSTQNGTKSDSPLAAVHLRKAKPKIIANWSLYLKRQPEQFKGEVEADTGLVIRSRDDLPILFTYLEQLNHRFGLQRPSAVWSPKTIARRATDRAK